MEPIDVYAEEKPSMSEKGKIWMGAFEKASPKQQYKLLNLKQQENPAKPARDIEIDKQLDPMQRMKNKEYKELLKERMKLLKSRTA